MKNTEEYFYSGIPTFMRSEYVDFANFNGYDVGFLGVPIDFGASYRLGAKYAPRKIREYSFWDRVDGTDYYDLDNKIPLKSNNLKIADLGDINIIPTDPERNNQEIIKTVSQISQKSFPLIIGGDHSVLYADFVGCKQGKNLNIDEIGLIYFDAHFDVEKTYLTLPKIWHGNVIRKLIDGKHILGKNIVAIGPRGTLNLEWQQFVEETGLNYFTSNDVREQGIAKVLDIIKTKMLSSCKAIYVSFDIDCLDISQISGTGTPRYGGLNVDQAITAMRLFKELPIIGLELVEINPKYDPSGLTAVVACDLIWNFLAFGLNKK